jgi:arabinose-5-phosphate isomerase
MKKGDQDAKVNVNANLKDAIIELSKKGNGSVSVIDYNGKLIGIITDGDIRRQLEKGVDVYLLKVKEIMTTRPIVISRNRLAFEALNIMKKKNISCLAVTEEGKAIGTIKLQDIIGVGIVG